jgi:spermidine synthase
MPQESQPERSTLGATLFLASALASFAAAGALLPVATRLYALGAGSTSRASTALLAAVAAGVVVGAWLGRRTVRPVRPALVRVGLWQCLLAIALAAAPALIALERGVSLRLWPLLGGTAGGDWVLRHAQGLALTGLPAAAVTALAIAVAALAREEGADEGPAAGFALGLGVAGIAVGSACGGMVLLPAIGMRSTFLVGLGLSGVGAAIAALCLRLVPASAGAGATAGAVSTPPAGAAPAGARASIPMVAAFVAGAGLAAAIVAWSRTVGLLAGPTEGGSAALLGVVMLGIGVGGFLAAGLPGTLGSAPAAALLSLGALAVFGSMYLVPMVAAGALVLAPGLAASGASVILAALVAGGLSLPGSAAAGWGLVALAAGRRGLPGDRLAATLIGFAPGVALGALVAVAGLVPAFGLRRTLSLAAVALLLGAAGLAAVAPWRSATHRAGAVLAPLALALLVGVYPGAWDPRVVAGGIYRYGASAPERFGSTDGWLEGRRRGEAPLFYREGSEAVVVVERSIQASPGLDPLETATLTIDGRAAAGTGTDMRTQVLTGTIPVLLHGPTDRALLIELLSGVTAGSMLRHPLKSLTVIEREPAVGRAVALFAPLANDPLADDRLVLVHDDPRGRLLTDRARYDVIVLAAGDPWLPHSAGLMTTEGYDLLKARLAAGGLLAQRLSLGAVTPVALPILMRTFAASFPSVLVFQLTPDDLLLAGSDRPLVLDGSWLRTVVGSNAGVAEDLRRAVVVGANEVIMTLRLDRAGLLKVAGQGPINDDDHAPVQRLAERDLSVQHNDATVAAIEAAWPGFGAVLTGFGTTDREKADFLYSLAKSYLGITADPVRALDIARELDALGATARARWVAGEARLQQKDIDAALREWEAVLALEPDNLDALFSLGTFHLDGRDDRAAERYLARAVAGHPEAAVVRYHYGRALFNLGRYDQAIAALRRARPDGTGGGAYPLVDYLVGLAAARLGRDDEAVTALRAYLTWAYGQQVLTRVEVDAHLKLAEVLERKGKRFDALQERQKGERLLQRIDAYGRMQQSSTAAPGDIQAPAPAAPPSPAPPAPAAPAPGAPVSDGR